MYTQADLDNITAQLPLLKKTAERELASIYGLTGMVYTPHRDLYMEACLKKAAIVSQFKKEGLLALSQVEIITAALDALYPKVKNRDVVEYHGNYYQRSFSPLKLSKSGKLVRKWAKYWLLQGANGEIEPQWKSEVHDLWPSYFVIRAVMD
ncbi:hypothetical protein KO495_03275 [Colwellia sp. D2M02]|uniref:hypothetical protein n=1 Tax=Colwellia sp. D2M02 TaxID=2841562 RepID=UPI001C0873B8|nr:hypothetical protein [Colwellia sp. D2M02]MBU2892343.1 hypothetical protein [Colwellia sp. D2M02]